MKPAKHLSMIRSFHPAAILIYFVACGVSRLVRYNVTAEPLVQGSDKVRYFEGTPIPSSLLLVIVIVIALVIALAAGTGAIGDDLWFGVIQIGPGQLRPLVLMFALSGALMISRTLHFRNAERFSVDFPTANTEPYDS